MGDLASLDELTVESILDHLQKRYTADDIYVSWNVLSFRQAQVEPL